MPAPEPTSPRCERCGAVLSATVLGGLCPHCVATAARGGPGGPGGIRDMGNYELLHELGRGGMGIVYLARQRALDRLVALKVLAGGAYAGAAAEERFLREAQQAARLHHPHIVTIYEVGRHDGHPFYSMHLVEGDDLATHAIRRRPKPRESAILVAKAARAIEHAHAAGVLHRDLKPANLLIDAAGEPQLTDFGLAVAIEGSPELTRSGEVLGSPGYMAPEQLRGAAGVASDVYGLGAILYFLLTGRPPFVAAQLPELLAAIEQGDPLAPHRLDPSLPRDLETVALRALAREPAQRYPSAAALAGDLERWVDGRPIHARPVSPTERAWHWARRNRALTAVAAGLALTVVLGVAGVFSQWRRAERAATNTALNLYSADLKVASDALLAGDLGLARRRLEACPPALRDAAWGLFWPLTRGDTETEIGSARWTVTHLAVSPDGALAASTAQADNVRLWNLQTAGPAGEFAGTAYSWWAEFSPDGRGLFTADRTVRQWDLAQHRVIREFPGQSGALSPAGDSLYTCDGQRFLFEGAPGEISAWRVSDGSRLFRLAVAARVIALSPRGGLLAATDARDWVALYDARDGHLLRAPWPSLDRVWNLTFSPDGSRLVASGWSPEVRVWDLADPARDGPTSAPAVAGADSAARAPAVAPPAVHLLRHPLPTWDTAFSPDGLTLAVACSDRQVHLWDTHTWQQSRLLRGHTNEVWSVAWQPDGRLLSAGRDPRLLRMRSDSPPEDGQWLGHDRYSYDIVWLANGRLATVREVEGVSFAEIASVRRPGESVRFAGETPRAFDAERGILWLWAGQGELRARTASNLDHAFHLPWTLLPGESLAGLPSVVPQAGLAWAALADGSLVLHRITNGGRVARFGGVFVHPTEAAALSPDGRHFVWGGASTEFSMLNLDTGQRTSLGGHRYEVSCAAYTPDGRTFVSGGADGLLIVWDAHSGRLLRELGQHATSVGRLAFSPDGKVIFSQEPGVGVHLWHPATGREIGFLPVKRPDANEWLGVSPDMRWFGLRLPDGSIRIHPIASIAGEIP